MVLRIVALILLAAVLIVAVAISIKVILSRGIDEQCLVIGNAVGYVGNNTIVVLTNIGGETCIVKKIVMLGDRRWVANVSVVVPSNSSAVVEVRGIGSVVAVVAQPLRTSSPALSIRISSLSR